MVKLFEFNQNSWNEKIIYQLLNLDSTEEDEIKTL